MNKALLTLAVAALLSRPATAQPGPGIAPASQDKPAARPPSEPASAAVPAPVLDKPVSAPLYDEAADAKADVAAAVAKAKKEGKRVLVTLGANWCGWCRALDRTFVKDETVAAALARSWVPVKVDVGKMTKNLDLAASWGADPKKGVPLLVVLDGQGKAVTVKDTGSLEAGKGHDPAKVIAFLTEFEGR